MINEVTYMEILGSEYPNVQVEARGDGSDYDSLVWQGGDPLPSKAELDADRATATKVRVWLEIKAKRDSLQQSGVKVGTHWFHSDNTSRIQQLGLLLFGASLPAGIMWKTLDGSFVQMTPTLAQQIFQASAISDMAIFAVAEQHKARMLASPHPTTYDFSGGWPPTFTGSPLL